MGNSDMQRNWICRCEEVREEDIRRAIEEGSRNLNDVKRRTRAGMGVCQGIYCLSTVVGLLNEHADVSLDALRPMTPRPPARLIPIAAIADMDDDQISDEARARALI